MVNVNSIVIFSSSHKMGIGPRTGSSASVAFDGRLFGNAHTVRFRYDVRGRFSFGSFVRPVE